ncbi:hypothetical protein [Pseudomonas sp. NFX183]|uniref:hypothetical protein n=1 Tax=Pseudomonas sp. NFX183 TaxID=3399573 RepID=UPI003A5C0BDB
MWNSGAAGTGGVGAGYAPNGVRPRAVSVAPAAEVVAVKQQLNELFDATGSKAQMAQRLSFSLKALLEKVDSGTFKNDLHKLIQTLDVYIASQAAVFQSIQHLFPDAGRESLSSRSHDTGHPRAHNGPGLRHPRQVSHNTPTQRMSLDDLYTDRSNPGRRPGVGNEPGNIWSGFKQGPNKSNCTTVAAIKVAMMKFGQKPTDIYKQVIAAGDGWNIQMRDDRWYHLSKDELAQATYRSEFSGDNPAMVADANFLYAVSAKRAQMENNDGYAARGFESALYSINDGEPFGHNYNGFVRLGLSAHIQKTTVENLARGQLGLVTHGVPVNGQMVGHSLAVINGREEVWGRQGGSPPTDIYANAVTLV